MFQIENPDARYQKTTGFLIFNILKLNINIFSAIHQMDQRCFPSSMEATSHE